MKKIKQGIFILFFAGIVSIIIFLIAAFLLDNSKEINIPDNYNYQDINELKLNKTAFKNENNDNIDFENIVYIKNNVIFTEIGDLAKCLGFDYKYNNNAASSTLVMEKYNKKISYTFSNEKSNDSQYFYVNIPGTVTYLKTSESPFLLNNSLVYVPIEDIVRFYNFTLESNKNNDIVIRDNDSRKEANNKVIFDENIEYKGISISKSGLSWKEIYINTIKDFIEIEIPVQDKLMESLNYPCYGATFDSVNPDKMYPYYENEGYLCYFSLHDFNNDGVPEILFSNGYMEGNYFDEIPMNCYWFNNDSKEFVLVLENCVGYDEDNTIYVDNSIYVKANGLEYYKLDSNGKAEVLKTGKNIDKIQKFIRYGGAKLSEGLDVDKIVNSYPNLPDSIHIDGIKMKYENTEIVFTGAKPTYIDNNTYIPVKDVFETMGYSVVWLNNGSPEKLQVGKDNAGLLITKGNELIFLPKDDKNININRNFEYVESFCPKIIDGTYMIDYYLINYLTGKYTYTKMKMPYLSKIIYISDEEKEEPFDY